MLRVIIRIPGHHRVLPDPENQSLNSLESSIHFPVPSWYLLKTSLCFILKCKGDNQATISRLSLSMTILALLESRITRVVTLQLLMQSLKRPRGPGNIVGDALNGRLCIIKSSQKNLLIMFCLIRRYRSRCPVVISQAGRGSES